MPPIVSVTLNIALIATALFLVFRPQLLVQFKGGRLWLTWLAVGVITLMDELTSVFYAPAEAFRMIGVGAIVFIPLTALFIHYMTTRMVEIAEILDFHKLKGGGVYNFSYLVLGPVVSFVAVASITVDYVLTAAISTVSAVENISYFLRLPHGVRLLSEMGLVWLVAGLNILGIRNNARITFGIFLVTAIVFINLVATGILNISPDQGILLQEGFKDTLSHISQGGGVLTSYGFLIAGLSSCILAYSGVESVMQTSGLVQDWRVVARAYIFLFLTVGIVTPLISTLVLTTPGMDIAGHQTSLITHYATFISGPALGLLVTIVASLTLLMAMNTAFVATSELMERVAHRYNFRWIIQTNSWASLYRIHILNALFFSLIIIATEGQQHSLASMYAIGLVATFVINLASLLIYRYFKGTKELRAFHASRTGTLFFFIVIVCIFSYLSYHRPTGFFLWLGTTAAALLIGIYGTRRRAPEVTQEIKGDNPMDLVLFLAEVANQNVHLYFKRPFDTPQEKTYDLSLFITFYSPRQTIPPRNGPNHFRIPYKRASMYHNIVAILDLLVYEVSDRNITVHFGWPSSSWFDRLSIGVMMFQIMRLPKMFPKLNFRIDRYRSSWMNAAK